MYRDIVQSQIVPKGLPDKLTRNQHMLEKQILFRFEPLLSLFPNLGELLDEVHESHEVDDDAAHANQEPENQGVIQSRHFSD